MKPAARAVALVVLGTACSSSHPPAAKEPPAACPATTPVLAISTSDRANASAAGQGRPVQVRVYQLKSDARLRIAKFEDIWQNDAAALATDFVKVDEYTLYPGETKLVKVAPAPEAHNLAAVALFREPQGKSWFLTYELEAPRKEPPCPAAEPRIPLFIDRMQMEDGQGRPVPEGTPVESAPAQPDGDAGTKGH
jgi:type VI secretion system protein VasD